MTIGEPPTTKNMSKTSNNTQRCYWCVVFKILIDLRNKVNHKKLEFKILDIR